MKQIPLQEAASLIASARIIEIFGADFLPVTDFTVYEKNEQRPPGVHDDVFLNLVARDAVSGKPKHQLGFRYVDNEYVQVQGNTIVLTLGYAKGGATLVSSVVELRLLFPLDAEAMLIRPVVDLYSPLAELLTDVEMLKEPYRNEAICARARAAINLYEKGQQSMPESVRKALEHVRFFFPSVDRVVYWAEGRWTFMTDSYHIPKLDNRICIELLAEAQDVVSVLFPYGSTAFQLPEAREDTLQPSEL